MKRTCRMGVASALAIALGTVAACASMPSASGGAVFVDGPSRVVVAGDALYVDEEFGTVLRRIDLTTRRSTRVRLPDRSAIGDLTTDEEGRVVVRSFDKAWRVDADNRLVEIPLPAEEPDTTSSLSELLPESLAARPGPTITTSSGDVYFATDSEYAIGRRIWRLSAAGELTTVVGPWATVVKDPKPHGKVWYPKSLGSLVPDGYGAVWFLDRGHNMILKTDLASGVVSFVAGGAIEPDPMGTNGHGDYVDLAADAAGNIYAADHGGRRVVRFDRETGRMSTVARVGGRREYGVVDGVGIVAEPDDIRCHDRADVGTFVVEVVDSAGAAIPGAEVYVLDRRAIKAVMHADAMGHARVDVPESTGLRLMVFMPGFQPEGAEFRASRGCTSTVQIQLTVGPVWTHRML